MSKYTEQEVDNLLSQVDGLIKKFSDLKEAFDSFPDLTDLERRLNAVPDFERIHPMQEVHPDIIKMDRIRKAIIDLYWQGGKRKFFSTKMMKSVLRTTVYNSALYKLVESGEINRMERGLYEITEAFIIKYIGE